MATNPVRIAVDAMGGDFAPREIVSGAIQGAREQGVSILLIGQPEAIEAELKKHDLSGIDYRIVPASEVVEMGEAATEVRRKRDASINVTAKCVKSGEAQAMVAAGSTGAAMAAASLYIRRLEGIERAAIGVLMPSISKSCLLIDAGANPDCTPEILQQFAVMGSIYMQSVMSIEKPRVGLMNIGEEEGKGNILAKATYDVLKNDPRFHFVGNIEGRDMFNGSADVAVCDGFTGNVALKSAEGVMKMFGAALKAEMSRTPRAKLGYLLARPAFDAAKRLVDPEEFGGALLMGIDGVCVISHGGSRAKGIKNAIRVAKQALDVQVLEKIGQQIREGIGTHDPVHT